MPNWTFNTITITGNNDAIKKFKTDAVKHKDGTLSLSSWMPIPETFLKYDTTNHPNGEGLKVGDKWWDGLGPHGDKVVTEELIEEFKQATKEQAEKYGVVGWYDYNVKTFGCKWDSEVAIESEGDGRITLTADTPWSAPNKWLRTLSKNYPELNFNLHAVYEEGFWEDAEYNEGLEAELGSGEYELEEEE